MHEIYMDLKKKNEDEEQFYNWFSSSLVTMNTLNL